MLEISGFMAFKKNCCPMTKISLSSCSLVVGQSLGLETNVFIVQSACGSCHVAK